MAQILIRNLDDTVVERLKKRASQNGRSLQSEVKMILEQASAVDMAMSRDLAEAIRKRFKDRPSSDSAVLLHEERYG